MDFKFKSTVFQNTAEDHKRLYGDRYDPNKPYPQLSGTISIPKGQLSDFVEYLHWAIRTELKNDSYLNDLVIPIKISGWQKKSDRTGKKFLSLDYTPDYKTLMAAREAKESAEIPAGTVSIDASAANLAQATEGSVVIKADSEDIF